jgi:hypothetical protein
MAAVRVVRASNRLPHQIRLTVPHGGHRVQVSCNCRSRRGESPFGDLGKDGDTVWEIYQAGQHHTEEGPFERLVTGERQDYALT